MKVLLSISLLGVLTLNTAQAGDDHFPAVESEDLNAALCNLERYNRNLQSIVNQDPLLALDMVKVHELTYTLENALAQIQKDLVVIAEDLEKVHKASEALNPDVIKQFSNKYLVKTTELVQQSNCR
jgi:DNA repair ATPase RecN